MTVLSPAELHRLAVKYFPDENPDKVLWVVSHESGGDTASVGDGGVAHGLFQSHYVTPGASAEQQFEEAASLYNSDKANGGTGWGDWGEGRLYQGKPFGSLGNNPYPGSGIVPIPNARPGDYSPTQIPNANPNADPNWIAGAAQLTTDRSPTMSFPRMPTINYPSKTAKSPVTKFGTPNVVKGYSPVGTFADDLSGYFSQMDAAQKALDAYKAAHSDTAYQVDDASGNVYKWVPNEAVPAGGVWQPDPEATRIFAPYNSASSSADRLLALQKAGLTNSPADAAKAYIASELAKTTEAGRQHADFTKRISDLAAVENVPLQRAQDLASALSTINGINSKRSSKFDTSYSMPDMTFTDLSPQAAQIKSNLGTDSSPYNMNPGALGSTAGQNQKTPVPSPDQVLATAGNRVGGGAQSVLGGIGAGIGGASNTQFAPTTTKYGLPFHSGFPAPYDPSKDPANPHSYPDKLSGLDDLITKLLGG